MTRLVAAFVLAAALLTASTASADDESYDGLAALVVGDILLPPALLLGDALIRPQSKLYGGFEVVVGGVTGLINLSVVGSGDGEADALFLAFTAVDVAVAAHGAYLLVHEDEGGKRVSLAPSLVSDGKATAPGFAVAGAW